MTNVSKMTRVTSLDNEAKKVAWKQHYEQLLNEECSWNPEDLTADPVVGPPIHIDVEMAVKAITKMKTGKAAGPSGIVVEMLKASGDTGARLVADLANDMVNGVIPSDWEDSFIINIYKGKGDALERGNYRGLKLLDHVMKGIERVIEKIIRERISIDDMQTLLRYDQLRWFGYVVRNDGCINSITEFEIVGQRGRGRLKKTWKDTINNDLRHWKLSRADAANRMEWRKKFRTNIGAVRPTLSGTDTLNK